MLTIAEHTDFNTGLITLSQIMGFICLLCSKLLQVSTHTVFYDMWYSVVRIKLISAHCNKFSFVLPTLLWVALPSHSYLHCYICALYIWKGIVEQAWQRAAQRRQRCRGKLSTAGRAFRCVGVCKRLCFWMCEYTLLVWIYFPNNRI